MCCVICPQSFHFCFPAAAEKADHTRGLLQCLMCSDKGKHICFILFIGIIGDFSAMCKYPSF